MYELITSHVWRQSVTYMHESSDISRMYEWGMSQVLMSYATQMKYVSYTYESCHSQEWGVSHVSMSHITHDKWHVSHMGWLQLVGSIKLQVSSAEYRLFCRALLQKRPIILSIRLTKTTPYEWVAPLTWKRFVSHMNGSVMPHTWSGHVWQFFESCHTNECGVSHVQMGHVTYMDEACHVYK